jgi:hypothetical protein
MYLACTFVGLLWTCDVPGAAFPPVLAVARSGLLTVALHVRRGPGGPRAPWSCTRTRSLPLPWRPRWRRRVSGPGTPPRGRVRGGSTPPPRLAPAG